MQYNAPCNVILCQAGTAGNNIDVWDHCNFISGAIGLYCCSDHARIHDCNFFYNGGYCPNNGTGPFTPSDGYPGGNIFSIGCGLMIQSEFGDTTVSGCHFFGANTGIVDLSGFGYARVSDTLFEGDNVYDVATMYQGSPYYQVLVTHSHWLWYVSPHSFTAVINWGANGYYESAGNTGTSIIDDAGGSGGDFSQCLFQNITPNFQNGANFSSTANFANAANFSNGANFLSGPTGKPTSSWPQHPSCAGVCSIVSSNGSAYVLVAGPTSATWVSTNKLAGP